MTDGARDREPAPPADLAAHVGAALREYGGPPRADGGWAPEAYVAAGVALLERLLTAGCDTRAAATDLLAADALVTYAFEHAEMDPGALEERAREAMVRLAAVAVGRG